MLFSSPKYRGTTFLGKAPAHPLDEIMDACFVLLNISIIASHGVANEMLEWFHLMSSSVP